MNSKSDLEFQIRQVKSNLVRPSRLYYTIYYYTMIECCLDTEWK